MRKNFLPFHLPSIDQDDIEAVVDSLKSGWLTTGPKTQLFEHEFNEYVGCRHAIAVNSCTSALHLALEAVGVGKADLVIVPVLTFTSTAAAVCYTGATPLFVDICPNDANMDSDKIDALLYRLGTDAKRAKAVIPVHYGGYPCDLNSIQEITRQHGLYIIEDAAHALPTKYNMQMIGTIGDLTAFSFYATKNITTGEGGMVTTENDQWAENIRKNSLHGMNRDAWKRYRAEGSWYYEVTDLGHKYNMPDTAAALGLQQLRKCDLFHEKRCAIAHQYTQHFSRMEAIELPGSTVNAINSCPDGYQHAWHLFPILVSPNRLKIDRNRFIQELQKRNIGSSVHFIPLHFHPYYAERLGYQKGDFPVAESFYERTVSLPIHPRMTDEDVRDVIEAVYDITIQFKR